MASAGGALAQATPRRKPPRGRAEINGGVPALLHSARWLETVALLHLGSLFAHVAIVSLEGGAASSALRRSEALHTCTRIAVGVQRYRFRNGQRTVDSGGSYNPTESRARHVRYLHSVVGFATQHESWGTQTAGSPRKPLVLITR